MQTGVSFRSIKRFVRIVQKHSFKIKIKMFFVKYVQVNDKMIVELREKHFYMKI